MPGKNIKPTKLKIMEKLSINNYEVADYGDNKDWVRQEIINNNKPGVSSTDNRGVMSYVSNPLFNNPEY